MRIISIILILLIQGVVFSYGQCTYSLSLDDTACVGDSLRFDMIQDTYESFDWDFCVGDLSQTPTVSVDLVLSNVGRADGLDIIQEDENFYGFVVSYAGKLFRLDFGDNLDNTPVVVDLGVTSLAGASDISFIKDSGGVWHGYVSTFGSSLKRIDFDSTVNGSITVTDLGNFSGLLSTSRGVATTRDGQNIYVVVTSSSQNTLTILKFNDGIGALLDSRVLNVGGAQVTGVDVKHICDKFYGVFSSVSTREVYRIDFGNDLMDHGQTIIEEVAELRGYQVYDLDLEVEGSYLNIILEEFGGEVIVASFKNNLFSTPLVRNFGDFGVIDRVLGIEFIVVNSLVRGFAYNYQNYNLFKINFPNSCDASSPSSNMQVPDDVVFDASGSKSISLSASKDGSLFLFRDSINLLPRPNVDFRVLKACDSGSSDIETTIISSNGSIDSWFWDFDGLGNSSEQNPSFTFPTAKDYSISLDVEDHSGCSNEVIKSVKIYDSNDLSADFSFSSLICSNGKTQLVDQSSASEDLPQSWSWEFYNSDISNEQNPIFTFPEPGVFDVTLRTTGISGCEKSIIKQLTVQQGPIPSFQVNDNCEGQPLQFTNESTGSIDSYSWDFGNGYTSNLENPLFEYSAAGTYGVTLMVSNAVGCQSDITKNVSVYQLPQVQFSNELSCEGSLTQLIDQSQVADANLQSWRWDFDDGYFSTDRDPVHNFEEEGSYDVKLVVTTTNGCADSTERAVDVKPAPQVDFSYDKLCIGEEVKFLDETEPVPGQGITSWAWDLGGVFSADQNPSITFDFPITYNVGLTATSQNLCSSTLYKSIQISPLPDINVSTELNCDNAQTLISDITNFVGDAVASRNWLLDGETIGQDSSFRYAFGNEGAYDVDLLLETVNGCNYSATSNIQIFKSPIAAFTSSLAFGAPPLDVSFTNESEGASTYQWTFSDQDTLTTEDAQHTFNEEADYTVELVATDLNQCSDTARQIVNVLFPDLELEIVNAFYQNGQVILGLRNNGTISLDSIKVEIDLGNAAIVQQVKKMKLLPGQQSNITLGLTINSLSAPYLCINVESVIGGISDSNPANNNICISSASAADVVVLAPQPNPADNQMSLRVVTKTDQQAEIYLYNLNGQLVYQEEFSLVNSYQLIQFSVKGIEDGLYILKTNVGGSLGTFKVAINH